MTRRWINYLALSLSAAVSVASAFGLGLLQTSRHSTDEVTSLDISPLGTKIHERVDPNHSQGDSGDSLIESLKEPADSLDPDLFAALKEKLKSSSYSPGAWRDLLQAGDSEKELNLTRTGLRGQLKEDVSSSLVARAKKWASDNPAPPSAYLADGKPDRFTNQEQEFVWVDGFWITAKEISEDKAEILIGTLKSALGSSGYSVDLPTEAQWLKSREEADKFGLLDFDGGLGEKISDRRIVGENTKFPSSKAYSVKALEMKDRTTKVKNIEIERTTVVDEAKKRARLPDYEKVITREKTVSETEFATRVVVVPTP